MLAPNGHILNVISLPMYFSRSILTFISQPPSVIRREYRKGKEGEGLGHYTANCDLIGHLSLDRSQSLKQVPAKEYEVLLGRILLTRSLAVFLIPAKIYAASRKEALAALQMHYRCITSDYINRPPERSVLGPPSLAPLPPLFDFRAGERGPRFESNKSGS